MSSALKVNSLAVSGKDDEGHHQDEAEQPGILPDRKQRVVGARSWS